MFLLFFCLLLPSSSSQLLSGADYETVKKGTVNTASYRIYHQDARSGLPLSPFHDIPLLAGDGVYNMVIEIPRWTNAKMEITKEEELNPIIQDTKCGSLRYVSNVFPYHGYLWNYGAIPQTWEDPDHADPDTGAKGDNDPVDAIEIGSSIAGTGDVKRVKVLGVLALVDGGETDWKVMCIDVQDPLAERLKDIDCVENELPGLLAATRDWFRIYKAGSGGDMNQFGFGGQWQNKTFAEAVLRETHEYWKQLVQGGTAPKIRIENTTNNGTERFLTSDEARAILANQADYEEEGPELEKTVDEVQFVRRTVTEDVCVAVSDDSDLDDQ